MITVVLKGGMGNQLFQWAFGRALSERHAVQYDRSWFEKGPRPYALGAWAIDVPFGEAESGTLIYAEPNLRFQHIPESWRPIVFDGHWQCEGYFKLLADKIRAELRPRCYPIEVSASAHAIAERIHSAENSCFVHIRRATHPTADYPAVHGILPMEYYSEALDHLPSRTKLFVFCDDQAIPLGIIGELDAWTTSKGAPLLEIISGNPAVIDMFLMSRCKHGIMANSTFSWWGAWLGPDMKGKVIAPRQWFAPTSHNDATDIVPERWLRI
jgi:Glycosyl transferase family 11